MRVKSALWRIGITSVVTTVLAILLVNVITQPVAPQVRSYTAEFIDASGLYIGGDVRAHGVRVGKVQSVVLQRRNDQSIAAVGFTLENRYGVVAATRLAIKYQSLTGARYVDVANASENYSQATLVAHVPTTMTEPSFDITTLFNGLQPVLTTLSPDEINTFTSNAATFLAGDDGGLAPMLESIHTLTKFVADRQRVVATLMRNLSQVAQAMGGHSKDMVQILDWLNRPLDGVIAVIDEFRKTELYGVGFLAPLKKFVTSAGLSLDGTTGRRLITEPPGHPDLNATNVDQGLDRAFSALSDFFDAAKLVPFMWENVGPPSGSPAPQQCSRGRFQLPEQMSVLLNGQKVVLCNH